MEDLHKMHTDLEKVIERDEGSVVSADTEDGLRHEPNTCRHRLGRLVFSSQFQVAVVVLVVVDVLLVLAELLVDVEVVKVGVEEEERVAHALHYSSLSILGLFLVEISLRVVVLGRHFFSHKLELFDAVIVIVSFILDIVFRDSTDAATGVGLLVILRLWRVTRILNGIVLSVKRQAEKKVERERQQREACEQELAKLQTHCHSLQAQVDSLQRLLKEHGIPFTHRDQGTSPQQVSVQVEVEVSHHLGEGDTHTPGGALDTATPAHPSHSQPAGHSTSQPAGQSSSQPAGHQPASHSASQPGTVVNGTAQSYASGQECREDGCEGGVRERPDVSDMTAME